MTNTNNPIELLVKISADTAGSKVGINKQLETLATQLEKLKVPIQIDPAAIKALTELSKLDFSKLGESVRKVGKETEKLARVSAKEVEQAMKKAGEAIGMSFKGVLKGSDVEGLKKQLQGLDAKVKVKYDMTEGKKQLESMTATIQKAGVASTTTFSKVIRDLGNGSSDIVWIPKTIQDIDSKLHNVVKTSDQFIARINKLQTEGKITSQEFEKLANSVNKMGGSTNGLALLNAQTDGMVASNKKIVVEQEKQKKQLKEQVDLQEKIRKLTNSITSEQGRNPKAFGNNSDAASMLTTLQRIDPSAKGAANSVKTVSDNFQRMKAEATEAGRSSMGVMDSFKTAMEKFPVWMAASTVFYGVIRGMRDAFEQIVALDSQMTILKRVGGDGIQANEILQESIALAEKLGNTISEVNEGFIEFARQGFRGEELSNLAEYAVLLSNISDLSATESSGILTAGIKAFNMETENGIHIVNALNEVDNNYSVTTSQLATSMQRAAGTASVYGASMERLIGYTTAVGEVTRESGSVIGNSLKSVFSRITSVSGAIDALGGIGIAIKDQAGEMRAVDSILDDLGVQWKNLSNEQQQNIGLQVAGRYQLSRFLVLMNQYDQALAATETATNSANSGYRENAQYLKSYEAQINSVKNAWTEAIISMEGNGFGDGIIVALNLGLQLFKTINSIVDSLGLLPTVLGAGAIAMLLLSTRTKGLLVSLGMAGINAGSLAVGLTRTSTASNATSPAIARTASTINVLSTSSLLAASSVGALSASAAGSTRAMSIMSGSTLTAAGSVRTFGAANVTSTATLASLRTGLTTATLATRSFMGTMAIAALPIAGLIAVGMAISAITSKIVEHQKAQKELKREIEDTFNKGTEAVSTNKDQVDRLISSYKQLSQEKDSGDWNTEKDKEYLAIQQELAELFPSLISHIDSKGVSHIKSAEGIDEEVSAMEHLLNLKREELILNAENTYEERLKSIEKFQDRVSKAETSIIAARQQAENGLNESTKKEGERRAKSLEIELKILQKMIAGASANMAGEVNNVFDALSSSVTSEIKDSVSSFIPTIDFSKMNTKEITAINQQMSIFADSLDEAYKKTDRITFNKISKELADFVNGINDSSESTKMQAISFERVKESIESKAESQREANKIDDQAVMSMEGATETTLDFKDALEQLTGVTKAQLTTMDELLFSYDLLASRTELTAEEAQILADTENELLESHRGLSSESLQLMDRYDELTTSIGSATANSVELAEIEKRLLAIHPNLIKAGMDRNAMIESIISNIKEEERANDILLAATIAASNGKLTAEENATLANLSETNARIKNINTEITALDKLRNAYDYFNEGARKAAIDAATTMGMGSALSSAMKASRLASEVAVDNRLNSKLADLATETSNRTKQIDVLSQSEEVLANTTTRGNKVLGERMKEDKKAAEASKKAKTEQEKYNETLKESIYLANTYKEAMEKLNLEMSRLNEIKSKYPTHSKEYKKALEQELAVLYQKKELIQDEAKYINSQISSGNVAKTGIVTKGASNTYTGKYAKEVNAAAAKHGIDANLIAAVIAAESNFNPNAKSGSGARGLMQLMPSTAKGLGVKDSYNPEQNIMGGAKYLAEQLKTFGGDIKLALAAYNAGPGNVKKHGGIPPFKETQNYVKKITDALGKTAVSTAVAAGQSVADYYSGNGFSVTSGFGSRNAPKSGASTDHKGVDLAAKAGTSIKSLRAGTVVASYYHTTGGNMVSIQQDDGTVAKYMHMQNASNVKKGQSVKAGQEIGKVGTTGNSTGNHLHLEIVKDNKAVDPLPYLKAQSQSISDASQAIAENLQDLDSLRSDLNSKSQDIFSINEQIRALQRSLIDVEIDKYAKKQKVFLGFLDEEVAKKDSLDLSSTRYQNSLKRSIKYIGKQVDEYKNELALTENLIKNGKLDAKVKEEMQEKAEALRLTLVGLNNEMKNFSVERINASQRAFAEGIADITYEIEKSQAIMSLYDEGSIEYNKEFTSQIEDMKSHQQQIKEQRDSLQRSLLLHDLNPETVKEYKDQIKQLGLEYWNLESSINSSTKELVESEKKMSTDLADKLIDSLKSYIDETKTMKLRALDEEMKVEDKRHKKVTDNLKKEMDIYRDLIQTKLDSIDKEESDTDYNKEMDVLGADKTRIQGELNLLSMDDSYEAKSQRKKLQEELTVLDETILDKRHKREVDLRKENLQEMLTVKEEAIAKEEEAEQLIHDNAKDRIDDLKTYWDQFYTDQLNDERRFAQLREDVMKGNFDNISAEFKGYLTEMEETMPSLENTMDGTMQAVGTSIRQNIIDALKEAVDLMGQVSGGGVNSAAPSHQGSAGAPPSGGSSSSGGTSGGSGKSLSGGDLSVLGGKFLADKLRSQETNNSRRETITDRARSMAADGRSQGSTLAANKGFDELVQGLSASEKSSLASYLGGRVQSMFSTPNLQSFIADYVKKLEASGLGFKTGGPTGKGGLLLSHENEFVLNEGQTKEAFKMADLFANLNRFASMMTTPKQPTLAGASSGGDTYHIDFNVDKMTGNESDVNKFTKSFTDALKRNKGVR